MRNTGGFNFKKTCRFNSGSFTDAIFQFSNHSGTELAGIRYDGDIRHFHHGGVWVFVDGDDQIGIMNGGGMLDGPTDTQRKEYPGMDVFSCLANQTIMIRPV